MELSTVANVLRRTGINAILHGPTGSGKTRSLQTIPNQKKTLILAAENGLLTIAKVCKNTPAIAIKNMDELHEAYKNVSTGEWKDMFETLAFDSLTEIAEQCLNWELKNNKDPRQGYGNLRDRILAMVRGFCDLPLNTIFICHQERLVDSESKIIFGPSFPGKQLGTSVPYQTDMVIAARVGVNEETGEPKYAWQMKRNDELYEAKCRDEFDIIKVFEFPDWGKLYKKLEGGK